MPTPTCETEGCDKSESTDFAPYCSIDCSAQDAADQAMDAVAGSPKFAARITDNHVCPLVTAVVPHVGGICLGSAATVLIGNLPAAIVNDQSICVGPTDTLSNGSPTVLINNMAAVRLTDMTSHGGMVVQGCPTVIIGDSGSGSGGSGSPASATNAFANAAESGSALVCKGPCEACGQL